MGSDQIREGPTMGETDTAFQSPALDPRPARSEIQYGILSGLLLHNPTNQEILTLIERVGCFLDVSRIYIYKIREDGLVVENTHEWRSTGTPARVPGLMSVPTGLFTDLARQMRRDRILRIDDVSTLPPGDRAQIEQSGTRAYMLLPYFTEGDWGGFVGVDEVRSPRRWNTEEEEFLLLLGQAFGTMCVRRLLQARLRASELHLQAVMDGSSSIVYVKDAAGRAIAACERFAEMFGLPLAEVPGSTNEDLFPPDLAAQIDELDHRMLSSGEPVDFMSEYPFGGRIRTYCVRRRRILGEEGVFTGTAVFADDLSDLVSARRGAGRAESALREALEAIDRPCAVLDEDHRLVVANEGYCRFFGISTTRADGADLPGHMPERAASAILEALCEMKMGKRSAVFDLSVESGSGEVRVRMRPLAVEGEYGGAILQLDLPPR